MRGPKPVPLELTARQQAALHRLTRRASAPQHLVRRARLILLAAAGLPNQQISSQLPLDRTQVRLWRTRWRAAAPALAALEASDPADPPLLRAIEHLLADAPRPGTPPTFTPEQVTQLVVVACEPPAELGTADHPLDAPRIGCGSYPTRHFPHDFSPFSRAPFKVRPICNRIAVATGCMPVWMTRKSL